MCDCGDIVSAYKNVEAQCPTFATFTRKACVLGTISQQGVALSARTEEEGFGDCSCEEPTVLTASLTNRLSSSVGEVLYSNTVPFSLSFSSSNLFKRETHAVMAGSKIRSIEKRTSPPLCAR